MTHHTHDIPTAIHIKRLLITVIPYVHIRNKEQNENPFSTQAVITTIHGSIGRPFPWYPNSQISVCKCDYIALNKKGKRSGADLLEVILHVGGQAGTQMPGSTPRLCRSKASII